MRKFVLILLATVVSAPAAYAADLSAGYPVKAAPVVPVGPNWAGFYGGLNIGYGFSADGHSTGGQTYYENTTHDSQDFEWYTTEGPSWKTSADLDGVIGGGQIGYNFVIQPSVLFGVEADFQWSGLKGDASAYDSTAIQLYPAFNPADLNYWAVEGTSKVTQEVEWFGTVRARLGVTTFNDSLLIYGTGGLAYGSVRQKLNYTGGFLPDAQLGVCRIALVGGGFLQRDEIRLDARRWCGMVPNVGWQLVDQGRIPLHRPGIDHGRPVHSCLSGTTPTPAAAWSTRPTPRTRNGRPCGSASTITSETQTRNCKVDRHPRPCAGDFDSRQCHQRPRWPGQARP